MGGGRGKRGDLLLLNWTRCSVTWLKILQLKISIIAMISLHWPSFYQFFLVANDVLYDEQLAVFRMPKSVLNRGFSTNPLHRKRASPHRSRLPPRLPSWMFYMSFSMDTHYRLWQPAEYQMELFEELHALWIIAK